MSTLAQKLIIDADPGIGDAVALALALADPAFDVVAVTAVAGCVSARQAGRNLQTLLEWIDPPKHPRLGVPELHVHDETHLESRFPGEAARQMQRLHGTDGLGSWQTAAADLHHPRDAAKLLVELVHQHPHEIVLLTLGPLTNVALAQSRDAGFLSMLKGLVVLGGTYSAPGDVSPVAELNLAFDPQSARSVLRSPATKTLVPLDISRKLTLSFEQYQRLNLSTESRGGRLMSRLLPDYLRAHHEWLGVEGVHLPEVVALLAVTHTDLFERMTCAIDIETEGELTRGMTVIDRRPRPEWRNNIDVLVGTEPQRLRDELQKRLERA